MKDILIDLATALADQGKIYADFHVMYGEGDAALVNATASLVLYGLSNALLDVLDKQDDR